jgi:hypothetical protein
MMCHFINFILASEASRFLKIKTNHCSSRTTYIQMHDDPAVAAEADQTGSGAPRALIMEAVCRELQMPTPQTSRTENGEMAEMVSKISKTRMRIS